MADYPNSIYEPRPKVNKSGVIYNPLKTSVLFADDIVNDDNEIVAIEETLGLNPQGEYETVAERLDDMGPGGAQTPWAQDIESAGFVILDNAETPIQSIDPSNRYLYGPDGLYPAIDFGNFKLNAGWDIAYNDIAYATMGLVFSGGNSLIYSTGLYPCIKPDDRILYANDGMTIAIDWSVPGNTVIETVKTGTIYASNGNSMSIGYGSGLSFNDYTSIATPGEGMIAFDFANHIPKYFDGSNWQSF